MVVYANLKTSSEKVRNYISVERERNEKLENKAFFNCHNSIYHISMYKFV